MKHRMKIEFETPTFEREHPIAKEGGGGTQKIWRFENGFGASVVRFSILNLIGRKEKIGSYGIDKGLWELAVIKFKGKKILDHKICYTTKITDDVIGHLTEDEVEKILKRISKLKGKTI